MGGFVCSRLSFIYFAAATAAAAVLLLLAVD